MYPQEDVPSRRTVRLPVDLEDRAENQIRPPRLLEEPWGEPVADEGAPGAVGSGLYGLARGRGDGVALVEGYHLPRRWLRYGRYRGGGLVLLEERYKRATQDGRTVKGDTGPRQGDAKNRSERS